MPDSEHGRVLEMGVECWNRWRSDNPNIVPDLEGLNLNEQKLMDINFSSANLERTGLGGAYLARANLEGAKLSGAFLSHTGLNSANLCRADLTNAKLWGTDLTWANLSSANLTLSDLGGAQFSGANLTNANLAGADLSYSIFRFTNLENADFDDALLNSTTLDSLDLSKAKNLDKVRSVGPSYIDITTLYKSKGCIPVEFLRSCGVPNILIDYLPSLTKDVGLFNTCFISYSTIDKVFCSKLLEDLRSEGIRCWQFADNARTGSRVWGEIDEAIQLYDKVVLICSKNSLESGPVLREIDRALEKEDRARQNHRDTQVLFPINIDEYVFSEWKHDRRTDVLAKVIRDFTCHTEKTAYVQSLSKLVSDLRFF